MSTEWIAFDGGKRIAEGAKLNVALESKRYWDQNPKSLVLVFDRTSGRQTDFDFALDEAQLTSAVEASERQPARKPGRPKLGVTAREVTLLPRHWDWLNTQRGGASAALRRLVDQARKEQAGSDQARKAQEATYRFMSAIAGDRPGFEEASRALFSGDAARFHAEISTWPKDIVAELDRFAKDALE